VTNGGTREQVLDLVMHEGGLHRTEICRQLERGWGTIGHHLYHLNRDGKIELERQGRELWAFDPHLSSQDRDWLVALQKPGRSDVLAALEGHERATISQLSDELEYSRKVVRTHLSHLMAAGAVERRGGRTHTYLASVRSAGARVASRVARGRRGLR
jgi:predicted transcriptional regulator